VAGATDILVNDGHGPMTNIELEKMNPKASLLSGVNKPLLQMDGAQDCNAAFFVGYHSKYGTLVLVVASRLDCAQRYGGRGT